MRTDLAQAGAVRVATAEGSAIDGDLVVPAGAVGVVAVAPGSGSGRHSPRNRHVATTLQVAGLATLLMDPLTLREEALDAAGGRMRFDIPLLAERTVGIVDWLSAEPATAGLPIGLFGASTGAAAALVAAALRPALVRAVVSRGGRPDVAAGALGRVHAPTLLVVGGDDAPVIPLNEEALRRLGGAAKLHVLPGATHLFEEPGAIDEVAALARDWFLRWLGGRVQRVAWGDGW